MEIINCKIFLIPKLTKKYWYIVLFLIGSLFRIAIPEIFKKDKLTKEENDDFKELLTQKYIEIIKNIVSDLLMGIFHCIYIIMNKEEYKEKRINFKYNKYKTRINFIFHDETRNVQRMIKLLLIISIVDIICQLTLPIKFIIENSLGWKLLTTNAFHFNSLLVVDVVSRYLFSLWILRTYFYAHHTLSFILNFISLIPLGIIDFKYKYKNYSLLYIFVIALQYILYSFEDITNKVAFRTLFILPTSLVFFKALFEALIFFPIISIFFFLFKLYNFEKINILNEIIMFLYFVPFNILRTFSLVNVIDKFSAQHMSFLKVSEAIIIFIYYLCINEEQTLFHLDNWVYIVQIIAFILLFISSLIHNEIIIINHPKLKEKVNYSLNKNADNEQNGNDNNDSIFSNSISTLNINLSGNEEES